MEDKNNKKPERKPPKAYSYYGLNKDEATLVWLIIMGVGSIFHDRWLIWIVATIWYLSHLE